MKCFEAIRRKGLLALAVASLALVPDREVRAQVPPHYPGTICATPRFWCWAPQPGYVGTVCACPSPYGWIQGVYI